MKFGDNDSGLDFELAPMAITLSAGDDVLRFDSSHAIIHGGDGYDKLFLGDTSMKGAF